MITQDRLIEMMESHKYFYDQVKDKDGNIMGERADFTDQDLSGLEVEGLDFRGALFKNTTIDGRVLNSNASYLNKGDLKERV